MTREEASNRLKQWIRNGCDGMTDERLGYIEGWFHKSDKEAFEQAIKALEQEPMRDATPEERESVDKYVKSISKPTGVNFWTLEQEPSGDLISREETLTAFADYVGSGMSMDDYDALWNIVTKMPSVNPQEPCDKYIKEIDHLRKYISKLETQIVEQEPKTGHWIEQDVHNCHTTFECSECGYRHSFMHLYGYPTADYTYCPNCGAKMEVDLEQNKRYCINCANSKDGHINATETCHLCMWENQFTPKQTAQESEE